MLTSCKKEASTGGVDLVGFWEKDTEKDALHFVEPAAVIHYSAVF